MRAVSQIAGRAIPLGLKNIDTDMILPGRYLKTITKNGLGTAAFEPLRSVPGNIFEQPQFLGAKIVIAGENFGCGSSREHAVWALEDFGIEAVIAPSFSDIFAGNAFKNGMLAIELPEPVVDRLLAVAQDEPLAIDLERQTVSTPLGYSFTFDINPFRKYCMLNGLDEIGLTLTSNATIADFEQEASGARPWVYLRGR